MFCWSIVVLSCAINLWVLQSSWYRFMRHFFRYTLLAVGLLLAASNPRITRAQEAEIHSKVELWSSTDDSKISLKTLHAGDRVLLMGFDNGYVHVEVDSLLSGWIYDSRMKLTNSTINWLEKHIESDRILSFIEEHLSGLSNRQSEYAGELFYRLRKARGLLVWVENEDLSETATVTYSVDGEVSQQTTYSSIWWRRMTYVGKDIFVSISAQKGKGEGTIHVEILYDGEQIDYNSSTGRFTVASTSGTTR